MPQDRLAYYKKKDPVDIGRRYLLEKGGATAEEIAAIESQVQVQLAEAIEYAKSSPEPDLDKFLCELETY